ncbi:anti-sigma factor [Roseomonas sp. KE2513]|nr:anti-sigma factor [Roseomonas sp. KE2513]
MQADVDGELQAAESARVAAHLGTCPACAELQTRLIALSGALRRDVPRHRAPGHLREAVRKRVGASEVGRPRSLRRWSTGALAAGALAAGVAFLSLLPIRDAGPGINPDFIVASHIRALQPQHLLDVVSTDQHTVKPWFAGRLPFAPPVQDLAAKGFPLVGARLDHVPGNAAAALVYKRREHIIDLFVWPAEPDESTAGATGTREGYNYIHWWANGMIFWAVSDLNARELAEFASLWR